MDTLAHGLWAAIGIAAMQPRIAVTRTQAMAGVALAVAPDLLQGLPLLGWVAFGAGHLTDLTAFGLALPGQEPVLPAAVVLLTHHLHCTMHSAVVAGLVSALAWRFRRAMLLPLLGWWSHIVIDVFTHSADYYAVPVLYPFTQRGFDGWAWNTPVALALNYTAIVAALAWLAWRRRRRH
jgi:membrane-bound metal-dependent hydrolase YbcI (DUF457 family)